MGVELDVRWAAQAGSSVGTLGPRYVNKVGTPIKSCVRRNLGQGSYNAQYNGQSICDVYTLTFNATGTLCYVAAGEGARNPWHSPAGVTIADDGTTEHDLVVPGLRIVFNACTNTDQAVVSAGAYLDAGGTPTRALNFGPVLNNAEVVKFRAAVRNIGDRAAVNVRARPCPALYYTGTDAEKIIARLGPHSSSTRDQLAPAGVLSMTFDTWTNQGAYYTANVRVGGDLAIATAKFDGATVYEHGDGWGYVDAADKLKGLQVVFAKITADPTAKTVTITVRDGWAWARLAGDVSGSPGELQNAELALGEIDVGATVYLWVGFAVPAGQARGNIRLWTPRLVYEEV